MIEENWDEPNFTYVDSNNETRNKYDITSEESFNKNGLKNLSLNCRERNRSKTDKKNRKADFEKYDRLKGPNDLIIRVEGTKIGMIIGKGGTKIKELQEKSGAKIKIGTTCEDDYYFTEVILKGNEEQQEICKKMINDLVKKRAIYTEPVKPLNNEPIPYIDWDNINKLADLEEAKKWKNLPIIKKNFYIEDHEVANMTEQEVETFRKNNNNILVINIFGKEEKILNPVKSFAQAFQHYPDIMKEIEKQGFETPSPIQCQAWPILLSGRDLIGIAQTGTGKTLAFLLPALIHINGQETSKSDRKGANVLVIAPTRELALQIEKEVTKYSYKNIKCVCVYGGGDRKKQMTTVTEGVEIIIATPGRLNDLVQANVIDVTSVTYLVLDEADRMLDMGFEPQIRKVLLDIRPDRQSVMTSATWPANVQSLAERYMNNPVQVYVGSLDLAAVHSVSQTVLVIDDDEKKDYLFDIINNLTEEDKIIIFVGKKIVADNLSCDLTLNHITCDCIHGDREQIDREQALEDLKSGFVKILIATDVASRGLDISDITKVINYDFPRNMEEYVHRVGRTGRAGKTGESISFFTRADWAFAGELITLLEKASQGVPQELYDMRDRFLHMQQKRNDEKHTKNGFDRSKNRNERYNKSINW